MLIHAQARAAHKTRRLCSDFTPRRRRGESLYCKRSLEIYFASGEDVPSDVVGKAGLPVGLRPRRGAGGRRLAAGDRRGASSRRRPDAAGTGCWRVLRRRGSGQTQRAIWRPSRAGASGGRGRSAGRERSGRPGASMRAGAQARHLRRVLRVAESSGATSSPDAGGRPGRGARSSGGGTAAASPSACAPDWRGHGAGGAGAGVAKQHGLASHYTIITHHDKPIITSYHSV